MESWLALPEEFRKTGEQLLKADDHGEVALLATITVSASSMVIGMAETVIVSRMGSSARVAELVNKHKKIDIRKTKRACPDRDCIESSALTPEWSSYI